MQEKRSTGPRESISNFEKICNIFNERLELDLFIFIIGLALCLLNGPDLSSSCYERVLFLQQFLNVFYLKFAALLFSSIVHTRLQVHIRARFLYNNPEDSSRKGTIVRKRNPRFPTSLLGIRPELLDTCA